MTFLVFQSRRLDAVEIISKMFPQEKSVGVKSGQQAGRFTDAYQLTYLFETFSSKFAITITMYRRFLSLEIFNSFLQCVVKWTLTMNSSNWCQSMYRQIVVQLNYSA